MAVKSGWWTKPKSRSNKASSYELSTGKSVLILGVIVACFAILWPRIFYPMIEVALRSPKPRSTDNLAMVHPRVRQHIMRDMRHQKTGSTNQPFIGSSSRSTIGQMKSKESGGVFNLLMPFYTIGLFMVFLYTILKFMSKDDDGVDYQDDEIDEEAIANDRPIIRDFQMDPNYRKFVFSEEYDENGDNLERKAKNKRSKKRLRTEKQSLVKSTLSNQEGILSNLKKDEQICELKKRLQVTEDAMERILKQIGSLNQILEAKGLVLDEVSNITAHNESGDIYNSKDEIDTKLGKNDDGDVTSGDSVYNSENQCISTTDYDSDSSLSTTSSKFELEE